MLGGPLHGITPFRSEICLVVTVATIIHSGGRAKHLERVELEAEDAGEDAGEVAAKRAAV